MLFLLSYMRLNGNAETALHDREMTTGVSKEKANFYI